MAKGKITTISNILEFLLVIDGIIRILFSTVIYYVLPELYQSFDLYFQLRWLILGIIELIFAFGLFKRKIWAIYGLAVLSIVRVYTVIYFPPKGLFLPIYSNLFTYILKVAMIALVFFILIKRKDLREK